MRVATLSLLLYALMCFDELAQSSQSIKQATSLFLSFGLIVLSAWLYRWWSVSYMLPGGLVYSIFPLCTPASLPASLVINALPTLLMAPFGFAMIRWVGISTELEQNQTVKTWRVIILGGFKASVLTFLFTSAAQEIKSGRPLLDIASQKLNDFPLVFVTEMLGLVTFMFVVMLILKLTRNV